MEPRIIYKPAFTIVGFSQEFDGDDGAADVLWDRLAARYQEIPFVDPDVGYGVHIILPENHRYLAGLGVTRPGVSAPADMSDFRIDPHTYAVFTHTGRWRTWVRPWIAFTTTGCRGQITQPVQISILNSTTTTSSRIRPFQHSSSGFPLYQNTLKTPDLTLDNLRLIDVCR